MGSDKDLKIYSYLWCFMLKGSLPGVHYLWPEKPDVCKQALFTFETLNLHWRWLFRYIFFLFCIQIATWTCYSCYIGSISCPFPNKTKLKISNLVKASALNLSCWVGQSTQCLGSFVPLAMFTFGTLNWYHFLPLSTKLNKVEFDIYFNKNQSFQSNRSLISGVSR